MIEYKLNIICFLVMEMKKKNIMKVKPLVNREYLLEKFPGKGGHNVYFLENPSDGKMYEISQRDQLPGGATTRVDHIAYRSEELEKDYTYCKEHGYKILSDEIEVSPNFWEKGSRCFKIESPCAFCQMHADSFGS